MSSAIRWSPEQFADFEKKKAQGKATAKTRLQALGRMKSGQMNKTESAYAAHLEHRKAAGEVVWYRFEAIKLILAPNTSITIDFFVQLANGELEAHDVKGAKAIITDDAWAKTKIAAEMFPFRFYLCFPKAVKHGGGWVIEEVKVY